MQKLCEHRALFTPQGAYGWTRYLTPDKVFKVGQGTSGWTISVRSLEFVFDLVAIADLTNRFQNNVRALLQAVLQYKGIVVLAANGDVAVKKLPPILDCSDESGCSQGCCIRLGSRCGTPGGFKAESAVGVIRSFTVPSRRRSS
jgi:hypothetical protein